MVTNIPHWATKLMESICGTIEFKGIASFDSYYSPADGNSWGIDLIEIAPSLIEIEEAGENDGEQTYGIIHNFDLIAAMEAFGKVKALNFGIENGGQPTITFEGDLNGNEVVVIVYTQPFEGVEPSGKINLIDEGGPWFEFDGENDNGED